MESPAQLSGSAIGNRSPVATESTATARQNESAQFVERAAKADMAQISLGLLAIEKAASDRVKDYGRQLIDTHIKSIKDLMELASEKNVFIPIDPALLPQDELNQLAQKPGSEFDKAFVRAAITGQVKTQADLQQFIGRAKDENVRIFAEKMFSNVNKQVSDTRELGNKLGMASEELNPPAVGEGAPAPETKPNPPQQ
jgi:putative membrane protein